jgi:hypothetical protein
VNPKANTKNDTSTTTPEVQPGPARSPPVPDAPAPVAPTPPPVSAVADFRTRTKLQLQAAYSTLIAGLLAFFQPNDVFALASGTVTRDELIAILQRFVSAVEATTKAHQAWQEELQNEHATEVSVRPVRVDVKSALVSRYGKSSKTLLKFGFEPAKQPVRTTKSKTIAVAKTEATRTARGTMGKKQKLAIKGNVTGVIITPVTSDAPVTTPQAAPVANGSPANGTGTPSQH